MGYKYKYFRSMSPLQAPPVHQTVQCPKGNYQDLRVVTEKWSRNLVTLLSHRTTNSWVCWGSHDNP